MVLKVIAIPRYMIAIANQKRGRDKTITAISLSACLAQKAAASTYRPRPTICSCQLAELIVSPLTLPS